jgi:hypothetical protein
MSCSTPEGHKGAEARIPKIEAKPENDADVGWGQREAE